MTNRPHVRKIGNCWHVYINGRMWYSTARFEKATNRAHDIASYARQYRFRRDVARIHASLERMEKN